MRSSSYLFSSLIKLVTRCGRACPSCGALKSRVMDRKWGVTTLRRCQSCQLLFRSPTTTEAENERIYNMIYREGFTTDIPNDATIARLIATGFRGHEKSYDPYIEVLRALGLGRGLRLMDYGCSWGYGSHQLAAAGFVVEAFEISKERAEFAAARLGVRMTRPEVVASNSYDVFFSAHVIEHVPSVQQMVEVGLRVLKPGGMFVAFTPNGSLARKAVNPARWHSAWGFVHPQLIDDVYLAAQCRPCLATSAPHPLDRIKNWDRVSTVVDRMEGEELMFALVKTGEPARRVE